MSLAITHRFQSAKSDSTDTTLINPSNWNDSHDVSGFPFLNSDDYDFTAQQPGGSLTSGITNTVTLTPVPKGVNGTDAGHYLYLTGGTGTAEAVLITGGTAVSNGASGTVTFVPANNHSGAWTIKSATAGIQEAENVRYAAAAGYVQISGGIHQMRAPISFFDQAAFIGCGSSSSLIPASSTASVFVNRNTQGGSLGEGSQRILFRDFLIDGAAYTGVNAVYGIKLSLQNPAWVQSICGVTIENMLFNNIRYAVYGERTNKISIRNCNTFLNTAIKITDTVGSPAYRSFSTIIENFTTHYTLLDGTGLASLGDYYITLEKCVVAFLNNINITGTIGNAGGLLCTNSSEGIVVNNFSIEMYGATTNFFYGLYFKETTFDGFTVSPSAIQLSNVVVDMVSSDGIVWDASTFSTGGFQASNVTVIGHPVLGGVAGIELNGVTVHDVDIVGFYSFNSWSVGNLYIAQVSDHVSVLGGKLLNSHATAPCILVDANVNYLTVLGINCQATSGTPITDNSTSTHNRQYIGCSGTTPIPNRLMNSLLIGPAVTAPGTPSFGFVLYEDIADGKLKIKGPSGTVTILGVA